jgi:hypothetical protein
MTKDERERLRGEVRRLAVELVCYTHPRHRRKREELAERIAELRRLLGTRRRR